MENMNLAIVTDDKEYGRALGLAILNICRTMIINLYDKEEFAASEAAGAPGSDPEGSYEAYDLVLWDGCSCECCGANVICLVEKPSLAFVDAATGRERIFKYSPARHLVADLFAAYDRITGRRAVNTAPRDVHIYACCAAAGGCGCSTIAMAMGQELKRFYGKQVLYLSLEEVESTGSFMPGGRGSGNRTMAYYLYELFGDRPGRGVPARSEASNDHPFLESFVLRDEYGVEAFRPTRGRNPLVGLTSEEISRFIDALAGSGRYDAVMIDAGCGLSTAAVTCLEMAERICLVTAPPADPVRETSFLQYLVALCGDDLLRRMIRIENRAPKGADDVLGAGIGGEEAPFLETKLRIGSGAVCAEEGAARQVLLEGDFGSRIGDLTKMLVEPLE